MSETKNTLEPASAPFPLTPESGRELSDALASFNFSLWGHGTPVREKEAFFKNGINIGDLYSGVYGDITQVAVPLTATSTGGDGSKTIADMEHMNHWPHRRGDDTPGVVLLAIPNPDIERQVYASRVLSGVMDHDQRRVPPELVVGYYDPHSREVTLNPVFDLNASSYKQEIDTIIEHTPTPEGSPLDHMDDSYNGEEIPGKSEGPQSPGPDDTLAIW